MDTFLQDARYGIRTLFRSPVVSLAAIVSIALGVGASTTIFTLLNAVFLNPLPVERPSELVAVYTVDARNTTSQFGSLLQVSHPNYKDFRDRSDAFVGLAAYSFPLPVSLTTGREPEQLFVELATGNYFDVLGLRPSVGRFFGPEEDLVPGAAPVLVLGYALWQRRFGGSPSIVGQTITLNGVPFTVVGVAPEGFRGVNSLFGPDLWAPGMMYRALLPAQFRDWMDERRALILTVAGRLKPGRSLESAEANLKALARALEQEFPTPNKGRSVVLRPLVEATVFPGVRDLLLFGSAVLMTIVGLVLLIACSNVANLLLAKATARRQEMAVRVALGALRTRLVRQLLTESIILALAGGALGVLLAYWGGDLLWSYRPAIASQNFITPTMDRRVLAFALAVSLLTGMLFGLAPALRASRSDVVSVLKDESRSAGRGGRRLTLRNVLVIAQVALSMVTLIAAGLFVRSVRRGYEIDPGFESRNLAVFTVSPGQAGYERPRAEQFYRDVRDRIGTMAGVRSVSWSSNLPLFGGFSRSVFIEGRDDPNSNGILANTIAIDTDFFPTVGIPVLQGRVFSEADREGSVPVAIINDTMAARFWPGADPIGKRFRFYTDTSFREVVGVVKTAKYTTLGETPQLCAYIPARQDYADTMVLYVRTAGDPAPLVGAVQREIRLLDSRMPVTTAWTIAEVIDQSLWAAKLAAGLLVVFGALALLLVSVGLYGVMAYSVGQRTREIGLRMALGATAPRVLGLVLRQGMTLVGIGVTVGLAAALVLSRGVTSLLYGVRATDPTAFAGASGVLLLVALLASYLPARRASRVDPQVALREG